MISIILMTYEVSVIDVPVNRTSRRSSVEFSWISPFHLPSRFLFLARSASRTSWLGAASAKSSSWWVGGSVGPSGGIAPGGGRGIITGGPAAAPSGRARPPDVWCRELWAAIGPLLVRFVGSVATGGCTAADIDRSTPPSSTGRQPPEAPLPLTAGRIPPPPGSGAYGKYSSSLRASSCNRVEEQVPGEIVALHAWLSLRDQRSVSAWTARSSLCNIDDFYQLRRKLTNRLQISECWGGSSLNTGDTWEMIHAGCCCSGLRENWWSRWIVSWIVV